MDTNSGVAHPQQQEPIVYTVPIEYFNVRFWLLCGLILFGLGTVSAILALVAPGDEESLKYFIVLLFILAHLVLAAIGIVWWDRVTIGAYWYAAIVFHVLLLLGLVVVLFGYWGSLVGTFLVFFCFILNLWSSDLRSLFRDLDGRCPNCHQGKLQRPRKNRTWTCSRCNQIILWKLKDDLKVLCPNCGLRLKGATTDMIGDTGVCPSCNAEFEIRDRS